MRKLRLTRVLTKNKRFIDVDDGFLRVSCHHTVRQLDGIKGIMGQHMIRRTAHTHTLPLSEVCVDPVYIWAFSLQCVLILLSAVFHLISLIIHF